MHSMNHQKAPALTLRRTVLMSLLLVLLVVWFLGNTFKSSLPAQILTTEQTKEDISNDQLVTAAMVQLLIQVEEDTEPSEAPEPESKPELEPKPEPNPEPKLELESQTDIVTKTEDISDVIPAENTQDPAQEMASQPVAGPSVTAEMDPVNEGRSPAIRGYFDVPVLDYLSAVEHKAGGRLLVWDKISKKAIGEVVNGAFKPSATLKGFSNRARDLTDDLPAGFRNNVIDEVTRLKLTGIWRFVLVVPERAEQQFQNAISAALVEADLSWTGTDLLNLRYQLDDDSVLARIESARANGHTVKVNQTVRLW